MVFTFTTSANTKPAIFAASDPVPGNMGSFAESLQPSSFDFTTQEVVENNGVLTATVSKVPEQIFIDGFQYSFFSEPDLEADDFALETGTYTIKERASAADPFEVVIRPRRPQPRHRIHFRNRAGDPIRTDRLDLGLPPFMKQWNAIGSFTASRSLFGDPSGVIEFIVNADLECSVRTQITKGKKITLFGIGFRVADYSFVLVQPQKKQARLTISFTGEHASYGNQKNILDTKFKLRGDNNQKVGWQMFSTYLTSVKAAMLKASFPIQGFKYLGKPIHTYVFESTSSEAASTLRDLLARAVVNKQYIVTSLPDRIEGRTWGKSLIHFFDDPHHRINSYSAPGEGARLGKVQLLREYRNTELILQKPEEVDEPLEPTFEWKFTNCKSLADLQTPAIPLSVGEDIYILKNPSFNEWRDPTIAFDTNGFFKRGEYIERIGGIEIAKQVYEYGWVISSLDVYQVFPKGQSFTSSALFGDPVAASDDFEVRFVPNLKYSSVSSAWKQTKNYTVQSYFADDGYLIRKETFGKEIARTLQDGSNLEGIGNKLQASQLQFEADELDEVATTEEQQAQVEELNNQATGLFALSDAYRFDKSEPVKGSESHELIPHAKTFGDVTAPTDTTDYVEPKYLTHSINTQLKRITENNPASSDEFPLPPIIRGAEEIQEKRIEVKQRKDPRNYVVTNLVTRAQGNGLADKVEVLDSGTVPGTPPIHIRRPIEAAIAPQTVSFGNTFITQIPDPSQNENIKYLLSSTGSNPVGKLPNDSIQFPNVFDLNLGQQAAKTQLSIDNIGSEVYSITTTYHGDWVEGDRLLYEGLQYVIQSIDVEIQIDKKGFSCNEFNVIFGRLLNPSVTTTKIVSNGTSGLATSPSLNAFGLDGNAAELNSINQVLSEDTIANALRLKLLEDFLQQSGLNLLGLEEILAVDPINDFLNGAFSGGGITSGGGSLSATPNIITTNRPEDGVTVDNRVKSNVENFADFVNRLGLINGINNSLDQILSALIPDLDNENLGGDPENGGGSSDGSGGLIFPTLAPNITYEGSDRLLAGLLNGLFYALERLIQTLSLGGTDTGVGSAGGSGGSTGSGDPSGSGSLLPAIVIGNLVINLPSTDIEGLLAVLLEMITYLKGLIEGFNVTPEDMANDFIDQSAANSSGGGSGGTGGGGGGGAGGSSTIELIYPDGVEPANITIVSPGEDLASVNLENLFAELDSLLIDLAALTEQDFGFEVPLQAIEPGAGLAGANTADGYNPFGGTDFSSLPDLGLGSGVPVFPGDNQVFQFFLDVYDISGTIGGGIAGAPPFSSGGTNTSGGLTGGASNSNLEGSGLISSSSPPSSVGDPTNSGGTSGNSSSDPNSGTTGSIGEFNQGGVNIQNLDVVPFEPLNFTITPILPSDHEFVLPVTSVDESISPAGQSITAPNIINFDIFSSGNILVVSAIATDLIKWEFVAETNGVDLLTPFDPDLTIEFRSTFNNIPFALKASLVRAPSVFINVLINTVISDDLELQGFKTTGSLGIAVSGQVDANSLIPLPIFTDDDTFVFTFDEPPHAAIAPVLRYLIQQRLVNGVWGTIFETTETQANFALFTEYRIVAVFNEQFPGEISDIIFLTKGPVIAESKLETSGFKAIGSTTALSPVEPDPFFAAIEQIAPESNLETSGFKGVGSTDSISPVEPVPFFATIEQIAPESSLETSGFKVVGSTTAITPVEPVPFFTT